MIPNGICGFGLTALRGQYCDNKWPILAEVWLMITAGYLSALTDEQFESLIDLVLLEIDIREKKQEENKTLV
jgi:hypothetical protein